MSSLYLKQVSKEYNTKDGPISILKNLHLLFESNKTYAIMGPSGCGKTTLLNLIAGLDNAFLGDIYYNANSLKDFNEVERQNYLNKEVSYLYQNNNCVKELSIVDNLNLSFISTNKKRKFNLNRINLKLNPHKLVKKLSGGESHRVAALRTLSSSANIILADEPTGNLDLDNAKLVMNSLKNVSKGRIFIFVTHDFDLANEYADEILEMKDGKIKKNFKGKAHLSDSVIACDKLRLPFRRKLSYALKFLSSWKSKTSIFISSFIAGLLCLGFAISLTQGFNQFFRDELLTIGESVTIDIVGKQGLIDLTNEDITNIKQQVESINFSYYYECNDIIEAKFGEEDIEIPMASFAKPPQLIKESLTNSQIIISLTTTTESELTELWEKDFDDLLLTPLPLSFSFLNNDYLFEIIDIFIADEYPDYTIFHSNPSFNELAFKNLDFPRHCKIINQDDDIEVLNWLSSTRDYLITSDGFLYKLKQRSLNLASIQQDYREVLPYFYPETNYYLDTTSGVYVFPKLNLISETYSHNNLVYFETIKPTLKYGFYPTNYSELIISYKLYQSLYGSTYHPNQTLTIMLNEKSQTFTIVGVGDEGERDYLFQKISWPYEVYQNFHQDELTFHKAYGTQIKVESRIMEDSYDLLSQQYGDYTVTCPQIEAISSLKDIINKVNIGFLILIIMMLSISLVSVIILSKLEIKDNNKQIILLRNLGWHQKDIQGLWLDITLIRGAITAVISSIFCYGICYVTNKIISLELGISSSLLSMDISIFLSILALTICLSFLTFLFQKNEIKEIAYYQRV